MNWDWPAKPLCHASAAKAYWHPPSLNYGTALVTPFEFCSVCGSIHPKYLFTYVKAFRCTIECKIWKNGWPDKFTIGGISNYKYNKRIKLGGKAPRNVTITSKIRYSIAYFHTKHMFDLDDTAYKKIFDLLFDNTFFDWTKNGLYLNFENKEALKDFAFLSTGFKMEG